MARTSKTKIGGGEGEQGERMMRAAEGGSDRVARAHKELMDAQRSSREQDIQRASTVSQIVGQGEERKAQREQFKTRTEQEASQFNRQMEQRQDETQLEAAKAGMERGPAGQQAQQVSAEEQPFSAAGSPPSSRTQQLEAEMNKGAQQPSGIGALEPKQQQNLQDQTGEPLEMDRNGKWRPSAAKVAGENREATRKDFEADTDRMRAMAYKEEVAGKAQRALVAGDKEAYEAEAKQLASYPNSAQDRFDRMMKNENVTNEDWSDLGKMASRVGDMNTKLTADIAAKNFSPEVQAFSRAMIAKDSLESIVYSQGSTNFLKIDWTNPKMVEFEDQRRLINMQMKSNPGMAGFAAIRSTQDKMNWLNTLSAAQVLLNMGQAPAGKGAQGMTPATSPQGQPGAPGEATPMHSQPRPGMQQGVNAVRGARSAGASPSQALGAGQQADPTANFGAQPSLEGTDYGTMKRRGL